MPFAFECTTFSQASKILNGTRNTLKNIVQKESETETGNRKQETKRNRIQKKQSS